MHPDPHSLLPIAYRAAARVVHNPVLAEEASERAVHQLTLALLDGQPPQSPKAWLRVVARRSACALLRSEWARTRSINVGEVAEPESCRYHDEDPRETARSRSERGMWVRENLLTALTPRQRQALDAAISCNTTRAAARSCGMQPRDFRRSLGSISRRAKELLAMDPVSTVDPLLPGCEPGQAM